MGPREGNSIIKHGVVDERLNVHGTTNLKVADLSICPDNVGCNTYSTALLIGEKCAVLTAEDLGYSGRALDMRVPDYQVNREIGEFDPPFRFLCISFFGWWSANAFYYSRSFETVKDWLVVQ